MMQIVIDIPKGCYETICDGFLNECINFVTEAIKNGIPLPKGHGRLIDADKTLKRHCTELCKRKLGCEDDCVIYDTFYLASTIIEADREVEND